MTLQLGDCLLLERLKEKGISQAEFARRMGITRQYVNKLIHRERTMSIEFAINAANILGIPVSEFRIDYFYRIKVVRSGVEA
ncbi:helix-turn-helix domain-containing protein [Paenibacillus azoreducens]|uniref:helix-turn-helix domain-containing protein n=1 Tax=Paenibacillus azoreducens TaxID=116718 RepID=UPI0039F62E99